MLRAMSSKFSRRSTSKLGEYRFVYFNTPQTAEHKFCSNSIKTSLCARERGPRVGSSAGSQHALPLQVLVVELPPQDPL